MAALNASCNAAQYVTRRVQFVTTMVSADNLDFDVLTIIFSFLSSVNDYASIALVSKSFLEAVIPRLYRSLKYSLHHAKRYPRVS
jgi:hypothetical protein